MRAPGQTVVVMALMMVVLVGMLGLSVDVGNAYGQQRRLQSAMDAAAIAGMLGVQDNASNDTVLNSIRAGLQGHGFDVNADNFSWNAYYIIPDTANPSAVVARNIQTDYPGSSTPPANIRNVSVVATERVQSYFARLVGRPALPAHAAGYSCPYTPPGVYPLGVPNVLIATYQTQYDPATWNYSTRTGTQIPTTGWTPNAIVRLPLGANTGQSIQHTGLVNLAAGTVQSDEQDKALLQPPGKFRPGPLDGSPCAADDGCFHEAPVPAGFGVPPAPPYSAASQANNRLEPYDWIEGNMHDIDATLAGPDSPFERHVVLGDTMILPMLGVNNTGAGGQTGLGSYQVLALGKFRLLAWAPNLNNDGYLTFQYLGPQQPSRPVSCTAKDSASIR
ncbi:MAG: hypothetical protein NVS4B8_30660 [Herpetosiphon sp.]